MKTTGHFPFVFLIAGNDAIAHKALLQTKVALSLRREDRRIAADLGGQLKAPVDHMVRSNSAFFSRSEKATLEESLMQWDVTDTP